MSTTFYSEEKRLRISKHHVWPFLLVMFVALAISSANSYAAVSTGADEDTKILFWQWSSEGMSIRWVQRLPDQTRAFFAARQFATGDAEYIVNHCVFQTIYKNTALVDANAVIEYDMADWKVLPKKPPENVQGLVLKKHWQREWQKRQVPPAAAIAFEWALLPTRHRLLAGDHNWGMTTFGLEPGERFDLEIIWTVNGKRQTATIPDMQCAQDVQQESVDPVVE